jgi:hypothetical protein
VKGFVDDRNRALLPIQVASSLQAEPIEILVWIDTAFDGHLVFSKELIRKLQLESLVETEAILADGSHCWEPAFSIAERLKSTTTRKQSLSLELTSEKDHQVERGMTDRPRPVDRDVECIRWWPDGP